MKLYAFPNKEVYGEGSLKASLEKSKEKNIPLHTSTTPSLRFPSYGEPVYLLAPGFLHSHWSLTAASWRRPTYRALRPHWLSEMLLRRGKPASYVPMAQGPISRQLKEDPIGLYNRQSNSLAAQLQRTCRD
jgi:hypothetical protein